MERENPTYEIGRNIGLTCLAFERLRYSHVSQGETLEPMNSACANIWR